MCSMEYYACLSNILHASLCLLLMPDSESESGPEKIYKTEPEPEIGEWSLPTKDEICYKLERTLRLCTHV